MRGSTPRAATSTPRTSWRGKVNALFLVVVILSVSECEPSLSGMIKPLEVSCAANQPRGCRMLALVHWNGEPGRPANSKLAEKYMKRYVAGLTRFRRYCCLQGLRARGCRGVLAAQYLVHGAGHEDEASHRSDAEGLLQVCPFLRPYLAGDPEGPVRIASTEHGEGDRVRQNRVRSCGIPVLCQCRKV